MKLSLVSLQLIVLLCYLSSPAQPLILKNGMKIHSSVTVKKDYYQFNGNADMKTAIIEIEGNDLVVDFNDATIQGSTDKQWPDEFYGIAVLVKGGRHITIKNLNIRGCKVALLAKDVEGLIIEHCDFSYNYRQHLNSTVLKEDVSDWMSYHHNEHDEWLRYGAAIYLRGCNHADIHNNLVTGGQCALMMTACNDAWVYSNDFSFNSGIGIGLYRSSGNKIMYNKLDWNVRGFSYGIYYRGQDSAAILVFEQCNENVFAYNSATHSGDGFFLWAGQTTMDTGKGGCNGNLLYENDFSYAPTNGVELTFSSNKIIKNRIEACDNGIWGGYSYKTLIRQNDLRNNKTAIAIEQGQENTILNNHFSNNVNSIHLWARIQQPSDWGYAKNRDVRSMHYLIQDNVFENEQLVSDIINTTDIAAQNNFFRNCKALFNHDSAIKNASASREPLPQAYGNDHIAVPAIAGARKPFLTSSQPKGKKEIRITEWGPYDFRSPAVWNARPLGKSDTLFLDILGPAGSWKLVGSSGVKSISADQGRIPGKIRVVKDPATLSGLALDFEFRGKEVVTPFGKRIKAGTPYLFGFKESLVPIAWAVSWYGFDSLTNPIQQHGLLDQLIREAPVKTEQTDDLHYAWWGGIKDGGKSYGQFLTTATGNFVATEGKYELNVTWNDVVKLFVDDSLVLDEWNPTRYLFDESPHKRLTLNLSSGKHQIRVQQAASGDFASLVVNLKRS